MHPNFEKYKKVSEQLHKIWKNYTDIIEYVALDEAYLDLSSVLAVASAASVSDAWKTLKKKGALTRDANGCWMLDEKMV